MADVPGLIPGASEGKGLGLEFLRHVERCSVLVHVVDCATLEPGRDPMTDLDVIEAELAAYVIDDSLGGRPLPTAPASSCSTSPTCPTPSSSPRWCARLEARGLEVHDRLGGRAHRAARSSPSRWPATCARHAPRSSRGSWSARGSSSGRWPSTTPGSSCAGRKTPDGEVFRVLGERPRRWINQTDFSNDEAVGYLADRLSRLGVEDALLKAGAVSGSTVLIGPEDNAVVFDWEPTMSAGAELLGGPVAATCGSRTRAAARPATSGARTSTPARTPRPRLATSWRRSAHAGHWSSVADED